jgi:regulator of protease activity HflC (stomatin/prohibitin superfamily)
MSAALLVVLLLAGAAFYVVSRVAIVVPQQNAYVVERLGKYNRTLGAGFHILVPFIYVIRYRHSLKEDVIDIPEQDCITRDNVQVGVDGVLYSKVIDPERASYGITNLPFAIVQLAQTTLRSEIGKLDLDRTFEERTTINHQVVTEIDKASEAWGVKVLRYEIKNIRPPKDITEAMEKQMRAEREKRAAILKSEGERDALINTAEGVKQQEIKSSEATKQRNINEAEGQAEAIRSVAQATADGIRQVAQAIQLPGGHEAVQLRVAEQYVREFGNLAKAGNTLIVPSNLSDVASMIAMAMNVVKTKDADGTMISGPR